MLNRTKQHSLLVDSYSSSLANMQHRFSGKAAVHEALRGICNLCPGGIDFDVRAQAAIGDETTQASKVV